MSGHAGLGVERAGADAHGGGGHGLRGGGGPGPIGEEGARTSALELSFRCLLSMLSVVFFEGDRLRKGASR